MIIRKCDFCGAEEGVEEVRLPQPNTTIVKNSVGMEVARYRQPGVYYKDFDICLDCQNRLFRTIETLTRSTKNGVL